MNNGGTICMADQNDQKVRRIQQAFQDVRSGLSDLRKALQVLTERINADAYVSTDSIARLSDILNAYKVQAEKLERAGAELSVPIGKDISEIENAIYAFEEQQNNGQIKRLLMDYFRLTADKARLNKQLEDSKSELMKKCMRMADPSLEALGPYALAVNYVRGDAEELPDDAYTILEDTIGDGLTIAVENHLIRYAETFDTTPYFDGSCKLLMPFGDAVQSQGDSETDCDVSKEHIDGVIDDVSALADESDAEGVLPDAFTASGADMDASEAFAAAPVSNGYSGILENAQVEYADNPSADTLNVREFKSAVQRIPGIPSVLRWFAEEKLYSQGQAGNSETGCVCANESEAMEYLIREGYIVQVSVRSRLLSGTYYTLSDKGWACYANRDVESFLQNDFQDRDCIHYAMLPVPKTMRIDSVGLNGMMAVRMALIHEFFVQAKMNASIIVSPEESCAYGFSIAETGCIVFPAIFNANADMQKAARDRILPLFGNFASIVLIVPRKTDIALLAEALALDETAGEHVFFSVQEDHFDNYDMHGNCLHTINDFAAAAGKTKAESVQETENETRTENETGTENESAFAGAVKRNNALLSDEDKIDGLKIDNSPNEDKKITSSIFISDIRYTYESVRKKIIKAIYPCECISAEMAIARLNVPENLADLTLEYLFRKGYLRRNTLNGVGKGYCASPRLRKAMQYADAIRFVGVRRMTNTNIEYLEEPEGVAVRIAQMAMEEEAHRRFLARNVECVLSNKEMCPFSSVARIGIEKSYQDSEVMICAIWRDTGAVISGCTALRRENTNRIRRMPIRRRSRTERVPLKLMKRMRLCRRITKLKRWNLQQNPQRNLLRNPIFRRIRIAKRRLKISRRPLAGRKYWITPAGCFAINMIMRLQPI